MNHARRDYGADLLRYFDLLRRRRLLILVVAALAGAAAYPLVRSEAAYRASSRVVVKATISEPEPNMQTQAEILNSLPVAKLVQHDLKTTTSPSDLLHGLSVSAPSGTEVLVIGYTAPDPDLARRASTSFARSYLALREERGKQAIARLVRAIGQRMSTTRTKLAVVEAEIARAKREQDVLSLASLREQRVNAINRLDLLEQRRSNALAVRNIQNAFGEVLEGASAGQRVTRNPIMSLALSAGLGVLFALGGAFLLETLQDRVERRHDITLLLGAPLLASVPKFGSSAGQESLVMLSRPTSRASEAYRSLRTNIEYAAARQGARTILITSATARQGKTITTSNLGVAFAQAGRRVLLVSGDLRLPTLETLFHVPNKAGLSTLLHSERGHEDGIHAAWRRLVQPTFVPRLAVLPSGPLPPNPAELLGDKSAPALIGAMGKSFDITLFDSPPALPVADASILASLVDGVVVVVDEQSTNPEMAEEVSELLSKVGAKVIGILANRSPHAPARPYG